MYAGFGGYATERLRVRPMEERDAGFVVSLKSRPEVYRYFGSPHPLGLGEHLAWFRGEYAEDPARVECVVLLKGSGRPVGTIGLSRIDGSGRARVDYALEPAAQGRGYAREALLGLCRSFGEAGGTELTAEIHCGNAASRRLAEGCGFEEGPGEGPFLAYVKRLGEGGVAR